MNKFVKKGLAGVAGIAILFSVAACQPDQDQNTSTHQNTVAEQVITEQPNTSSPSVDDTLGTGPGLCVGVCVGPHLDLNSGEFRMIGTGPGLDFGMGF